METMTLSLVPVATDSADTDLSAKTFDIVVGSDGVNSLVRSAMEHFHPSFRCTKERLPGEFKVVRLDHAPPNMDPGSASLVCMYCQELDPRQPLWSPRASMEAVAFCSLEEENRPFYLNATTKQPCWKHYRQPSHNGKQYQRSLRRNRQNKRRLEQLPPFNTIPSTTTTAFVLKSSRRFLQVHFLVGFWDVGK